MSIRVLIVEDNPITAKDLQEILVREGMLVIGIKSKAEEVIEQFDQAIPDVLLVDIKLKGPMDGIEMVRIIQKEINLPIVYLTANSDYQTVDRALKTKPVSFLTKPFDEREVIIAVELAFNNYAKSTFESSGSNTCLFLKNNGLFEKVPLKKILYLEADGSYCKVISSEKEYFLTGNLNHYCNQIDHPSFWRIHRSFVVNSDNISGFDNDFVFIDQTKLPIGRSYKSDLKKMIKKYS